MTADDKYSLLNRDNLTQLQAVIKLIEKRDRDKRFIKNWRPISLLNTDTKLISKALAARVKQVLPSLVSFNQTVAIWTTALLPYSLIIWKVIESEKVCFSQTQSLITVC